MIESVPSTEPIAPLSRTQRVGLGLALAAFLTPLLVSFPGLSVEGHRVFAIFLMAIVLWITEAIPLFATAAVIILLEILMISDKGVLAATAGFVAPSYKGFFATLSDPILMLFLGGFFLADAAAKYRLDHNLAAVLLRPFGRRPLFIMMGLMAITALFSMFMSNTATTATMMAVVLPVLATLPPGDRMRTGIALSIPVAANIGGMGTPIGTPPNAIALGAMAQKGVTIGFPQWMAMVIPFMLIILVAAWVLLATLFRSGVPEMRLALASRFDRSRPAVILYITFAVTIALWMTEELHGMSSSIVGFFPVAVLLSTRVFSGNDLRRVQWPVLWLVAGGIALGHGVGASGLDRWLIGLIRWDTLGATTIVATMSLAALLLGTFISHSATANLLVPIGMSLAGSDSVSISPALAGTMIAVGSSLAMALPISTPPNAIALATGAIKTRDMLLVGALVGVAGWLLFSFVAPPVWSALGVLPQ